MISNQLPEERISALSRLRCFFLWELAKRNMPFVLWHYQANRVCCFANTARCTTELPTESFGVTRHSDTPASFLS